MFNGVSCGLIAGLCVLSSWLNPFSWGLGAMLGLLSWNELRGRALLRRFEPRGAKVLIWNQLGLMVLLVCYCIWKLYTGLTSPGLYSEYRSTYPELNTMLASIEDLHSLLTVLIYGSVLVLSIIIQGINARYYQARSRTLRDFLERTPNWIVDLHRA